MATVILSLLLSGPPPEVRYVPPQTEDVELAVGDEWSPARDWEHEA